MAKKKQHQDKQHQDKQHQDEAHQNEAREDAPPAKALAPAATAGDVRAWLLGARVGDSAVYHVGQLACDRRRDAELGFIAGALFRLSDGVEPRQRDLAPEERGPGAGFLLLTQRALPRNGTYFVNEYRATVRRKCEAPAVELAFFRKAEPRPHAAVRA